MGRYIHVVCGVVRSIARGLSSLPFVRNVMLKKSHTENARARSSSVSVKVCCGRRSFSLATVGRVTARLSSRGEGGLIMPPKT